VFKSTILQSSKSQHCNARLSSSGISNPKHWPYVELVCRNYFPGVDIMFAYDNPSQRNEGLLYLGQFNDGVVES
jgi:hypothetical protein